MTRNTEKYGRFYWCVKTSISESGEIYLFADKAEILSSGALCFSHDKNFVDGKGFLQEIITITNLSLAAGKWDAFYAASCLDGAAVAVEHWEGEVVV